jgi:hypothetical protein
MTTRIMDCGECFLGKAHLEEVGDRLIGSCQRCGYQFNCSATPTSTNDIAGFVGYLVGRLQAIDKLKEARGEKPDVYEWDYSPAAWRPAIDK